MTDPTPLGDGAVPDKVLEELLAAFANDPVPADIFDLDDPSFDELLGLTRHAAVAPAEPVAPAVLGSPPVPEPPPLLSAPAELDDLDIWRRTSATVAVADPTATPAAAQVDAGVAPDAITDAVPVVATSLSESGLDPAPVVPRAPIKIGGDDLPDAVYLNEEAEERLRGTSGRATEASMRGERTTIFIGDDEVEGMSGGIPVVTGSAAMDPRLRARRIAVQRAVGRKRLKWFVIIGAIVVLLGGALALLGSSLFAVHKEQLVVSGAHRIDTALLSGVVNDLAGTPVLLVDNRAFEHRLETSPWVQQARVSTTFPHGATIELVERVPIATYRGSDGRYRILAADGTVVDVIAGQPVEFMLITGSGANVGPGSSSGEAFTHAGELVEALSASVRTHTESVEVSDTGELSLHFHRPAPGKLGATVILGGPTNLLDKLTRLEAFLQQSGADQCTLINVSTAEISQKC